LITLLFTLLGFSWFLSSFLFRAAELFKTGQNTSYLKLRASAAASVIDTTDVAWAWLREVCFMRKRYSATREAVKKIQREELLQLVGTTAELKDDEIILDV
jgi:hypothetical protein